MNDNGIAKKKRSETRKLEFVADEIYQSINSWSFTSSKSYMKSASEVYRNSFVIYSLISLKPYPVLLAILFRCPNYHLVRVSAILDYFESVFFAILLFTFHFIDKRF